MSKSPREVAIDEKSAVLVDRTETETVVGTGKAYIFFAPRSARGLQTRSAPHVPKISVYRAPAGAHFNLTSWTGDGGTAYSLSVEKGKIASTQANQSIY